MPTLAKLAEEFAAAFETRKRDDGSEFECLKADSPEWMTDIIRDAHGDMMPNDVRYKMIAEVATAIDEALTYDADADLDDERHERIDGLIPVYNWDRLKWLSSHLSRANYCDDAVSQGLADGSDMFALIGAGIGEEYGEIWQAVADGLAAEVEEEEDDESD